MARRLTLRARVALATALAILLAVVLLGSATLALVGRQLHRSLDRGLRDRAAEVARLVATTPALVTAPGVLEGRVGTSAAYVEVVDREGRIVARSAALGGRVLPPGAPLSTALRARRGGYGGARLGDERLRVYAAPLGGLGGGPASGGAVAVAGSTSTIADTLNPLRHVVLLAALVSAALAALIALFAMRRALRPLTRLTAGAEQIARTGDPGRRLPQDGGADELGRLAGTLNAMLDALQRARERERRFVGDASHELRTPLTALRGNAAYVARHGADPAALADIEADAERLAALLDDLLALAREDAAEQPAREPVDLVQLARAVVAEHPAARVEAAVGAAGGVTAASTAAAGDLAGHAAAGRAVAGDVSQAAGAGPAAAPVVVLGDRAALERALRNLVENAERHGPAGGRIVVRVTAANGRARLAVTDEGAGLAPEQAEQAFARFWRGPDAPPGGTGLGLAIVRATAERHGGRATASGSTFVIELPFRELSDAPATTLRSTRRERPAR
jgi:signal transduction histidine kinase